MTPISYRFSRALLTAALMASCLALSGPASAGAQAYELLSASARAQLQKAISDKPVPRNAFQNDPQAQAWLASVSKRLETRIPAKGERDDFVRSLLYESRRAGLEPELVLGVMEVESAFRKYAVSTAGAQGYMQVMPFWVKEIGIPGQNLFHLRNNLRYGCTILRHYLDIEKGDLYRALGRYNGSLGRPEYPNMVLSAWKGKWNFPIRSAGMVEAPRGKALAIQ